MAAPYSIPQVTDIPPTTIDQNIILGRPGQTVDEDSQVIIYATRESVDVTMGVTLGQQVLVPVGSPTNINTVAGSLPSVQDDELARGLAAAGNDIIIQGENVNAAAQELRVLVKVTALDDLAQGFSPV